MKLTLKRIEEPFVMELTDSAGASCLMDAHKEIGGKGKGLRPMELLAGALAGCISVDVLNILKKQRVNLKDYTVVIDAKRVEGIPAPFESINMIFEFAPNVDSVKASKNIQMTIDKYCSVSACLKEEIKVTFEIKIKE